MIRKIIHINKEKCNGCGLCVNACHEGALGLVDGKATLLRDDYCDGFGDCLPECPTGAISFEEREAAAYDEAAVEANKLNKTNKANKAADTLQNIKNSSPMTATPAMPHTGCPGSQMRQINRSAQPASATSSACAATTMTTPTTSSASCAPATSAPLTSQLSQWPVQIKLAPINAPYFDGARLLIAADCSAYAYANFHQEFIKGRITLIGCPKLDAVDYSEKLTEIIKNNNIKSVTVVRMEVPCCGGLERAAITALQNSGKMIPWRVVTVNIDGTLREDI